jgi:ribosomal-protein-alanine N-acetyltransferase
MTVAGIRQGLLKQFPVLESPRLLMRQIVREDTPEMFRNMTDPRIRRNLSFRPDTLRFPDRMFRFFQQSYLTLRDLHFAVELKQQECNGWIGLCSLQYWDEDARKATLGYFISPSNWNKGYATEAVQTVLSFGFNRLNLALIEARCHRDNSASERVLQKCGMNFLGEAPYRGYGAEDEQQIYLKIYCTDSNSDETDQSNHLLHN